MILKKYHLNKEGLEKIILVKKKMNNAIRQSPALLENKRESKIPCQLIVDVHEWYNDCFTVSGSDLAKM